jgi:hypothetical protein
MEPDDPAAPSTHASNLDLAISTARPRRPDSDEDRRHCTG